MARLRRDGKGDFYRAQRGDAWVSRYRWTTAHGTREQKTVTVRSVDKNRESDGKLTPGPKTQKLIDAAIVGLKREVEDGERKGIDLHRDPTLKEWCEYVLETVLPQNGLKPTTIAGYEALLRNRVFPLWGVIRVKQIRRNHIRQLRADLESKDLSPQSVKNTIHALSACLTEAVADHVISENPAHGRGLTPKTENARTRVLTPEEVTKLLATVKGHYDEGPIRVALFAGLRIGEVCGLRWSDVDLDCGTFTVSGQAAREKGKGVVRQEGTKSHAGKRSVPICPGLLTFLKNHHAAQQNAFLAGAQKSEFVFTTENGTPVDKHDLSHRFKGYERTTRHGKVGRVRGHWDRAGLSTQDAPVFHDLRRTFATQADRAGSSAVVKALLGHARSGVTEQHYVQALEADKRAVVIETERLILGHPDPQPVPVPDHR